MNTTKQTGAALGPAVLAAMASQSADLATAYGHAFLAIAILLAATAATASALPTTTRPSHDRDRSASPGRTAK